MIVGTDHFDIHPIEGTSDLIFKVKRYFDGRHTFAEISRILDVPEEDIRALADQFASLGLLRKLGNMEPIPTDEFIRQVKDACVMWGRQIGFHRLFRNLETGKASREVFLGLLIETYHYVNSASRHVGTAISQCDDLEYSRLLSQYFAEEYNHGPLVLQTCVNLGLPAEEVKHAHPTIGTISLINMLCEIGRQSTLAYVACTSLVEARREDTEKGRDALESIARSYGYSHDVLLPLIEHRTADLDAGHEGLLETALRSRDSVTIQEAHVVVNALHDLKHTFDQFHDDILQYYSAPTNYIPRLKIDYFAL